MTTVLAVLVSIGLAWLLISALYWRGLYPVLRKRTQYRLYAYRDSLRQLAVNGVADPTSHSYRFAERAICILAANPDVFTLYNFVKFSRQVLDKQVREELERFHREAPLEVRQIWKDAAVCVSNMMFANSPIIVFLFFSVVVPVILAVKGFVLLFRTDEHLESFAAMAAT